MISKTATASVTVRPLRPPMSRDKNSGTMPSRLVNPIVERMPTKLVCDDGPRIELPVSVPSPTAPKLAVTAGYHHSIQPELDRAHRGCAYSQEEANRLSRTGSRRIPPCSVAADCSTKGRPAHPAGPRPSPATPRPQAACRCPPPPGISGYHLRLPPRKRSTRSLRAPLANRRRQWPAWLRADGRPLGYRAVPARLCHH